MQCQICSGKMAPFARGRLLDSYDIQYYQCSGCGFTQTEAPYWLGEAYSEAINDSDVGLISRNIVFSRVAKAVIPAFFDGNGKFVDYGGGYGVFVRIMRDAGFDFYLFDKYCPNLFAKRFEVRPDEGQRFELLTAFEIFEHLVSPIEEIEQMLRFAPNILFTTMLIPPSNPQPADWWYYGLEHGQHVSLYTHRALLRIARRFQLLFYSNGSSLHLFTKRKIPPLVFKVVSHPRLALLLGFVLRQRLKQRSLLADDYCLWTGRKPK